MPSAWNSWIVGVLIAVLAITRMSNPIGTRGVSMVNVLLGIWVFVSPWIYGLATSLGVGVSVSIVGLVGSSIGHTTTTPPPALRT